MLPLRHEDEKKCEEYILSPFGQDCCSKKILIEPCILCAPLRLSVFAAVSNQQIVTFPKRQMDTRSHIIC
jgi:hypothetical protein